MADFLKYTLAGGLSEAQIERIHKDALEVLNEVGVNVPHPETLQLLSKHKCVSIEGTRVRYEPDVVNAALKEACAAGEDSSKREKENSAGLKARVGGIALHILDIDTGKIRDPLNKDLVKMTKLADSLGMEGVAPVIPQDVHPKLQDLAIYKVCWENSRNIGGGRITSLESAEYIYQMAQIAGKPFSLPLWVSSPLEINPANLEIILHFLDRKVPMHTWSMPLVGVSAPIFLRSAIIQGIAECLGGLTTLQLITRGGKVSFGLDMCPFDMKYSNAVYGSPEHNLIGLMQFQIFRFYGFPVMRIKGFKSMGKEPDAQAAAERAMAVLAGALLGAKVFHAAGRISEDELFSGEQLVIDNEIINYVSRFVKGFELEDKSPTLKLIKEGVAERSYLSHPSTAKHYREIFWIPELFEYSKLDQWKGKGGQSIRERAKEIARKRIKEHHFQLDNNVQKELDKVWNKANQSLG